MICQRLTPERFGFVLALFYRRQLRLSNFSGHWPLTTGHCSRATDHHSPVPRGFRSCADPSPLATAIHRPPNSQRPNRPRSRRAALYIIQYVTEPGDSCEQGKPFSQLAVDQPLAILTWHEALHASGSRRACLIHIKRGACSLVVLRDLPEFAQAVRYGVLASGKLWKGGRDSNSETFR